MKETNVDPLIQKKVFDLGAAAYLLMHGYKVVGRQNKAVVFEIEQSANKEFDSRKMEYLSSEFHRFDSCLMSLKKMNDEI
jgi:hypothetical protein